jgi:hypothetical protein
LKMSFLPQRPEQELSSLHANAGKVQDEQSSSGGHVIAR